MIEIDQKAFIAALNEVAATDNGKIVLAMLKDSCQWDATYLSSEDANVTQFYAVKRGIYGGIRQHINREHLIPIEFNYKRKPDDRGNDKPRKPTSKPSDRVKRTK